MSALGAEKFQQAYELLDSGEDEDLLVLLNHCLIFTAISKVMYCSWLLDVLVYVALLLV